MSDTKTLLAQQKQLLRTRMAELRGEIDAIKSKTNGLRKTREAKVREQLALDAEIEALTAQINAAEQPRLHELKQELAEIARAESAIKV